MVRFELKHQGLMGLKYAESVNPIYSLDLLLTPLNLWPIFLPIDTY